MYTCVYCKGIPTWDEDTWDGVCTRTYVYLLIDMSVTWLWREGRKERR